MVDCEEKFRALQIQFCWRSGISFWNSRDLSSLSLRDTVFVNIRKSVLLIQHAARIWIAQRHDASSPVLIKAAILIQKCFRGWVVRSHHILGHARIENASLKCQKKGLSNSEIETATRIQMEWNSFVCKSLHKQIFAATKIHSRYQDSNTAHSLKCGEELVASGAIGILLKLICAPSHSIPDQEVLKRALSTLRNLARYPHLTEVLINTPGSVKTNLWELHRNKEAGYFIASEILKKKCSNQKGVKATYEFPALLKRLHNLFEELITKANIKKRNPRAVAVRENTDRRLKEAVELLKLIANG